MKIPTTDLSRIIYARVGSADESKMAITDVVKQLEEAISSGNFASVKRLLDDVVDLADVKAIEKEFSDRDPVVFAVDHNKEQIAVYLVEKQFSTDKCYCYPGEDCEPHCYVTHKGSQCPAQYTALDLAKQKNMTFLYKVISDTQAGRRKAGDSLNEDRRISVDSTDCLDRQQFLAEINDHNMNKHLRLAQQLGKLIGEGDYIGVKRLLVDVVQINEVEAILREYPHRDPLIEALEGHHEKIACYLIEKRFPFNTPFCYPGQECDEWCSRLHADNRCPNQYTALDVAKQNKLRSVQGLIEGITAGTRPVGLSLSLEKRVSIDSLPVFERDVIMATDEYRTATQLSEMIEAGDLEGVKNLIEPITDMNKIQKIEYVFDDGDPVTYSVEKDQPEIAQYLISKSFSFTRPYRMAGSECDRWCFTHHEGKVCPRSYTAMSLARDKQYDELHQYMTQHGRANAAQ